MTHEALFDLLIIEDDTAVLHLLHETFSEQGWTVRLAEDIAQARIEMTRSMFRVVLSDYNLPDGFGVDFLAEMRGTHRRTVPILMTGLADLNVAVDAINRGNIFRFVAKPLDIAALITAVHLAIEQFESLVKQDSLTHDILAHNRRLQSAAVETETLLRNAHDRIRSEEQTVEQQKAHIESLSSELQSAYLDMVTSLMTAIEAKDPYTKGHGERVSRYCTMMEDVLGLPDADRSDLRFASVLHDLGKIGIPDNILRKPGPLTPEEHRVMSTHVAFTDHILKPLPFLGKVRRIIREHHEKFDGSGYPEGLQKTQISLAGRILSVADAFDAMRSHRAYRKALDLPRAIRELKAGSGTQFCPLCVGALVLSLENQAEAEQGLPQISSQIPQTEELIALRLASDPIPTNSLFG
ncbi:MAG: HD domain-containing protein [bacterium]|nr:HD domain-containing protein [bacterium]